MSLSEKLVTVAENVEKVFEAGKKSEYDAFWDEYQKSGSKTLRTMYMFGATWTDEVFNPKYDVVSNNDTTTFYSCRVVDFKEILDKKGLLLITTADANGKYPFPSFRYAAIKHIPKVYGYDGTKIVEDPVIESLDYASYSNGLVHTIEPFRIKEKCTSLARAFEGCPSLENVTILSGTFYRSLDISQSPLTAESVKSIVMALEDISGTSLEFSFSLTLSSIAKENIDAEGATSPNGNTWREYILDKGWTLK